MTKMKTTREWRDRRQAWMESAARVPGIVHDDACLEVHDPCAALALIHDVNALVHKLRQTADMLEDSLGGPGSANARRHLQGHYQHIRSWLGDD